MMSPNSNVPVPDLRIIPVDAPQPHEEHDSQRSEPLIETLQTAEFITNPPIVTHTEDDQYIVLDGANRCHSFAALGVPHILVQVVSYYSEQVELQTWNHVISQWTTDRFLDNLTNLPDINIQSGQHKNAIAHLCLRDGRIFSIDAPVNSVHERSACLRRVVRLYQRHSILNRTPIHEPDEVWNLYPESIALVIFPKYEPKDIIDAVRYSAFLPPGISRHIVHGRALQLNYPMSILKDEQTSLQEKNKHLREWVSQKFMNRQVRFYAESTFQFSE